MGAAKMPPQAHSTRGGVEEWTARRGRRGRPMPVWARLSARCHQTSGARALWVVWWPPDRLNCLLLIEAASVSRLRMQWSNWSVPSLLVRNQVILICCIACGSRPYCESLEEITCGCLGVPMERAHVPSARSRYSPTTTYTGALYTTNTRV